VKHGDGGAEVGVVIVHGMGDPQPSFAVPLIEGLSRLLGADAGAIAFEPCFWSDILQPSQDDIWARLQRAHTPMRFGTLRRWVVGTLGDPTGYLSGYEQGGIPVLHRVHQRLADSLAAVERRLTNPAGGPLVVLAHSLGCVVVTNYLWNLERAAGEVGTAGASTMHPAAREVARRPIGDTPIQRLETLAGMVTFGCNIPLFLPPISPYECVRFPRPGLPAHLTAAARWLNVYDPYDVLGYPLNDLWDESHGTVIDDVALDVGMPGISMTPLSHSCYWTDAGFQSLVLRELRRVLDATRGSLSTPVAVRPGPSRRRS
jgi:hypothetical protein